MRLRGLQLSLHFLLIAAWYISMGFIWNLFSMSLTPEEMVVLGNLITILAGSGCFGWCVVWNQLSSSVMTLTCHSKGLTERRIQVTAFHHGYHILQKKKNNKKKTSGAQFGSCWARLPDYVTLIAVFVWCLWPLGRNGRRISLRLSTGTGVVTFPSLPTHLRKRMVINSPGYDLEDGLLIAYIFKTLGVSHATPCLVFWLVTISYSSIKWWLHF